MGLATESPRTVGGILAGEQPTAGEEEGDGEERERA